MDDCVETKWCRNRGLIETLTVQERLIGMCWVSEWRQSHSHSFSFSLKLHATLWWEVFFFSLSFFLAVVRRTSKTTNILFAFLLLPVSCAVWSACDKLFCGHCRQSCPYENCTASVLARSCDRVEEIESANHFNPKNVKCKLFFIISFVIPIFIFMFFFSFVLQSLLRGIAHYIVWSLRRTDPQFGNFMKFEYKFVLGPRLAFSNL